MTRLMSPSSSSLLAMRMGHVYLRARWFWGVGMLLLPLAIRLTSGEFGDTWLVAAAGAVMLTHALGMTLWQMHSVVHAVFVDLVATHLAVMILSLDRTDHAAVLLAMVGFTLLIMLFTQGATRVAALAVNGAFTFVTIGMADNWAMESVYGPFLGAGFVAAIVIAVMAAFNKRLAELEMARAVTLGIASHELRNRLTGVIGVTQLLTEDMVGGEEATELLHMAHREAEQAEAVIDDLLMVSRTERGMTQTAPARTDLVETVRNVIATFESSGMNVKTEGLDEPLWVRADPLRSPQVVRNLLSNAQRYGGSDIRVAVIEGGGFVSLLVSDDGPGVDREDLPGLFTPYQRTKKSQVEPGSTGLGLWISRNLMRSMDGDLAYRRIDDRTVFEATFPICPPGDES